jgi:hypothetical protein
MGSAADGGGWGWRAGVGREPTTACCGCLAAWGPWAHCGLRACVFLLLPVLLVGRGGWNARGGTHGAVWCGAGHDVGMNGLTTRHTAPLASLALTTLLSVCLFSPSPHSQGFCGRDGWRARAIPGCGVPGMGGRGRGLSARPGRNPDTNYTRLQVQGGCGEGAGRNGGPRYGLPLPPRPRMPWWVCLARMGGGRARDGDGGWVIRCFSGGAGRAVTPRHCCPVGVLPLCGLSAGRFCRRAAHCSLAPPAPSLTLLPQA